MRILQQQQYLPISIEKAWEFFSTPHHLELITPADMHFKIISDTPEKIYEGLLLSFKISPFFNLHLNWDTEITAVTSPYYFVDEQRRGPYKVWRHEHIFKPVANGVLITDIVQYEIGKSILGWMAGKLYVHQRVDEIFKFRKNKLCSLFEDI